MLQYQLELKQLVTYPRCRLYRQFIQSLIADKSIRIRGCSCFFEYVVLCAHANYRSSYQRIEGSTYLVGPGEWICPIRTLTDWFRCKYHYEAISILETLQSRHYITYSILTRNGLVKFHITDWDKFNTQLEYNAPCCKDSGFFFFPVSCINEFINMGKCSEMDIILDLWMNAVYNDERVDGSFSGPVVYFRDGTGSPLVSYSELGKRWGMSKASVGRVLKKLQEMGYLDIVTFPGRTGSVIYLRNYLSTMFQVSDVLIEKEEIALSLHLNISVPDKPVETGEVVPASQVCGTEGQHSVSKWQIRFVLAKLAQFLAAQGFVCCSCGECLYKLSNFSWSCRELSLGYRLEICCLRKGIPLIFELRLKWLGKDENMEGIS